MTRITLLLWFCVAMFVGAYLAGLVPLRMSMNPSRLRLITIFGAGLLVGTALIVIIPEGVAMHYQSQLAHAHLDAPSLTIPPGVKVASSSGDEHSHALRRMLTEVGSSVASAAARALGATGKGVAAAAAHAAAASEGDGSATDDEGSSSSHTHTAGQWQIGAALSLGFAFQLIVDRLSGGLHGHAHGGGASASEDEDDDEESEGSTEDSSEGSSDVEAGRARRQDDLGRTRNHSHHLSRHDSKHRHHHHTASRDGSGVGSLASDVPAPAPTAVLATAGGALTTTPSPVEVTRAYTKATSTQAAVSAAKSKSALAGLVVHAMVDGVALGAAVREGDSALGMLVFLAIILHKAPSSFGLTSYLLHQGLSKPDILSRLLIFSCAAPLGALATYGFLSASLFVYTEEMLALCLLFSGGTFLYVATAHILPEIQSHSPRDDDDEGGEGSGKLSWTEVAVLVFGVLCPLLIDVHGGHGH